MHQVRQPDAGRRLPGRLDRGPLLGVAAGWAPGPPARHQEDHREERDPDQEDRPEDESPGAPQSARIRAVLHGPGRALVSGNEMIAAGAISAGCLLRRLSDHALERDLPEMMEAPPPAGAGAFSAPDEISALSYARRRVARRLAAMTATSGPGCSLMGETVHTP